MLVLTRKINEEIRIGDNITVTILKVRGQIVRVGIEAPKDVRILRSELNTDDSEGASSVQSVQAPAHEVAAEQGESAAASSEVDRCSAAYSMTCRAKSQQSLSSCDKPGVQECSGRQFSRNSAVGPSRPLAKSIRRPRIGM